MDLSRFIGLPYQHRGSEYTGCDCYGMVRLFYRDVMNIEIPNYQTMYSNQFHKEECEGVINAVCGEWLEVQDIGFGSVLTFNILGAVSHVGVHIGDGDFVHSFNGTNSCIESIKDISWNKRLHKAYEWQTNQKH